MATARTTDSDSDYDWDLSPEDEQQLASIAPLVSATAAVAAAGAASTDGTNSSSSGRKDRRHFSEPALPHGRYDPPSTLLARPSPGRRHLVSARADDRNAPGKAIPQQSARRSLSTSAQDDDVSYPDCTSAPQPILRFLSRGATD